MSRGSGRIRARFGDPEPVLHCAPVHCCASRVCLSFAAFQAHVQRDRHGHLEQNCSCHGFPSRSGADLPWPRELRAARISLSCLPMLGGAAFALDKSSGDDVNPAMFLLKYRAGGFMVVESGGGGGASLRSSPLSLVSVTSRTNHCQTYRCCCFGCCRRLDQSCPCRGIYGRPGGRVDEGEAPPEPNQAGASSCSGCCFGTGRSERGRAGLYGRRGARAVSGRCWDRAGLRGGDLDRLCEAAER